MRLEWDKRYATLAPVATVIGLAFKLHDPDHLLGDRDDLGAHLRPDPRTCPAWRSASATIRWSAVPQRAHPRT